MYVRAKEYKGVWLAPGSDALALLQLGKIKELEALLQQTEKNKRKLEGK